MVNCHIFSLFSLVIDKAWSFLPADGKRSATKPNFHHSERWTLFKTQVHCSSFFSENHNHKYMLYNQSSIHKIEKLSAKCWSCLVGYGWDNNFFYLKKDNNDRMRMLIKVFIFYQFRMILGCYWLTVMRSIWSFFQFLLEILSEES